MKIRKSHGVVSDLAQTRSRADWSGLTSDLRQLQPSELLTLQCPRGVKLANFRATVLTYGRRIHTGDWALAIKSNGNKVSCFLVLKESAR